MSLTLSHVTFDCDEPARVAAFWSAALGRTPDDGASEFFVSLSGGPDGSPTMFFIKVGEHKTVKNRVHLDLDADDRAGEVERLVGLGARKISDHDEWGHVWTVMNDVEGNEFCVAEPTRARAPEH